LLNQYTHDDFIDISIRNQLVFEEASQSDKVTISVKDIFFYVQ